MENEITLHEIARRLDALETAVASLTIDFSFEHIGGKKVGHVIPVKTEKEIDFSLIGGKCVRKASDHPMFNAKPEESVEREGDARE
jgi:hypothetical protein